MKKRKLIRSLKPLLILKERAVTLVICQHVQAQVATAVRPITSEVKIETLKTNKNNSLNTQRLDVKTKRILLLEFHHCSVEAVILNLKSLTIRTIGNILDFYFD